MGKLTVPNDIVDGTLIEAGEHQQNYKQIESFVNGELIHADGSVAMDSGSELLLGKAASVPLGAVTKAQLDNAVFGDVAGGGYLPLAGGTLTGDLTVNGQTLVHKGSGAAPGLAFSTGDSQQSTGMFYHADYLGLVRDGATKVLVYPDNVRVMDADLQVDGLIDGKLGLVPADFWNEDSGTVFTKYGMVGGSQGSYNVAMTANGYRNTSNKWTSLARAGNVGAAQIALSPTGTFMVSTAGNFPTGSAAAPPARLSVDDVKTKVFGNLEVVGQVTTGAGKAVHFGGNWAGASIVSSASSGREYMTFGDQAGGGSGSRFYGGGDSSYPGNAYIYGGGEIAARFDKDQNTKLYAALTVDGQIQAHNGSSDTPGFQFASSATSGMYYNSAYLGMTFKGVWKLLCYESYVRTGVKINNVDGTKAAPAYSFQSDPKSGMYSVPAGGFDSTKIVGIAANGKEVANFGDKGVSFPTVLDSDWTDARPNIHMNEFGQLQVSNNWQCECDKSLTVVEKLSETVDELTAKVAALVARVDASESIK